MSVPNKSKSRLVEQMSASARRIPSSDITDLPWPTNDCSRVCHFVYKIVNIRSREGFDANRVRPARKRELEGGKTLYFRKEEKKKEEREG